MNLNLPQARFGAYFNVSASGLQAMNSDKGFELAELTELATGQKADFEQLDSGKKDKLTIQVQYAPDSVTASVSSQTNGGFQLNREAGQTLAGFLSALKTKTQTFVDGLLSPEEKQNKLNSEFKLFITKVDKSIQGGDFELVAGSAKTEAATGSDVMHGGHYSQTAQIEIDGEKYYVHRAVKKRGTQSLRISKPIGDGQGNNFVAANYTVDKDPGGDVKKDRVGDFTYQSPGFYKEWLRDYNQNPQPTQVMLQNMMTKMENMFNQLQSAGVLLPFQG
jgi:hypothetical protein